MESDSQQSNQAGVIKEQDLPAGKGQGRAGRTSKLFFLRPWWILQLLEGPEPIRGLTDQPSDQGSSQKMATQFAQNNEKYSHGLRFTLRNDETLRTLY